MQNRTTTSRHQAFRARSRTTPRSRGRRQQSLPIVIVGAQTSTERRTFLFGSIKSRTQTAPAHVRIVKLG